MFSDSISNRVILVLDGTCTYIFIQKSSEYKFQRLTYSIHKNIPLVKPFRPSSTNGSIMDVLGPYLANGSNNDSSIITHIIKYNYWNFKDFMKDDDILVVNQGFRDALDFLNDCRVIT